MKSLMAMLLLLACVASASAAEVKVIGKWYDDVGVSGVPAVTLLIELEGKSYFLDRRIGDESSGRFRLTKSGNTYILVGDEFGAKYVVTDRGLELHDREGYIRTAKKIQ